MKYLFLGILALLAGAGMLTVWSQPDARTDIPIIYWVTDSNPARQEQVKLFHQWMLEQGHTVEKTFAGFKDATSFFARNRSAAIRQIVRDFDPQGNALMNLVTAEEAGQTPDPAKLAQLKFPMTVQLPATELRVDMGSADRTKKVLQGVSGVAGDVMDQGSGADMRYFRAIGLNTDVTEPAKRLGFGLDKTYPALEQELAIRDMEGNLHQYQFPCNVTAQLFFVNRATFRQHGQSLPPDKWTIDEFERRGREFVRVANEGLPQPKVFFANNIDFEVLRRTYGGSRFNETATAANLDAPTVEALKTFYRWMYVDRLIPTSSDRASFTTDSGYGGQDAQLFGHTDRTRGQYGMMWTGRYLLIEFRKQGAARQARGLPPLDMMTAPPPHELFPNTSIGTRAAMVYSLGKHKDLAVLFLAFLASKEYNMQIVRDGDALPPDPAFTKLAEYIHPAEYPNEWDVHVPFAQAATTLAVGGSYSPFILHASADRIEANWRDKFMNNLAGADEAARATEREINEEIARKLDEDRLRKIPVLNPLYEVLTVRQKKIDEMKTRLQAHERAGRAVPEQDKIPAQWIENPFFEAFYRSKGWLK